MTTTDTVSASAPTAPIFTMTHTNTVVRRGGMRVVSTVFVPVDVGVAKSEAANSTETAFELMAFEERLSTFNARLALNEELEESLLEGSRAEEALASAIEMATDILTNQGGDEDAEIVLERDGFSRNEGRYQKGGRRAKTLYKGSSRHACTMKRYSHHAERVAVRSQLSQIGADYEDADVSFDFRAVRSGRGTRFNSAPVFRPVLKCIGMHWEEAYNKVASRHPGRKGWSLRENIYCALYPGYSCGNHGFKVDEEGVVRRKEDVPKENESVVDDTVQALAWVGRRLIGQVGSRLFWFEKSVKRIKVVVYGGYYHKDHESFPQGRPLTRREIAKFNSFSEATRNKILAMSPVASKVK